MAGNQAPALFRSALETSARRLGIDPVDLGTAISYETAGTFDPWKKGPHTRWGTHRGLTQWGEPQRAKYGVYEGMPVDQQFGAIERYLTDAGVRPGMGLPDVYSAINAGRVGRYNASDAAAGGAPGTVMDKVRNQMDGHRAKAEALLAGTYSPSDASGGDMRTVQNSTPGTGQRIDGGMMAAALDPKVFEDQRRTLGGVNASTPGLALAKALAMGLNGYGERQNSEAVKGNQQAMAQALLGAAGDIPGMDQGLMAQIAALNPELAQRIATQAIAGRMEAPKYNVTQLADGTVVRTSSAGTMEPISEPGQYAKPTPRYRPLTQDERAQFGIKPTDDRPWSMSPEGKPEVAGGSGVTVNNNNAGEGEFQKKAAAQKADYYGKLAERGAGAASAAQELGMIDELAKMAPQGPLVGRLAEMFPGVSSAGDAFIASVNRIAPALRVPGSGAQSDRDIDILMSGLPRLRNQPEANAVITQAFRAKVQIDQERAVVANAALNGKITPEEADKKIQELESKSILPDNMRQLLSVGGGEPAATPAQKRRRYNPATDQIEDVQ